MYQVYLIFLICNLNSISPKFKQLGVSKEYINDVNAGLGDVDGGLRVDVERKFSFLFSFYL